MTKRREEEDTQKVVTSARDCGTIHGGAHDFGGTVGSAANVSFAAPNTSSSSVDKLLSKLSESTEARLRESIAYSEQITTLKAAKLVDTTLISTLRKKLSGMSMILAVSFGTSKVPWTEVRKRLNKLELSDYRLDAMRNKHRGAMPKAKGEGQQLATCSSTMSPSVAVGSIGDEHIEDDDDDTEGASVEGTCVEASMGCRGVVGTSSSSKSSSSTSYSSPLASAIRMPFVAFKPTHTTASGGRRVSTVPLATPFASKTQSAGIGSKKYIPTSIKKLRRGSGSKALDSGLPQSDGCSVGDMFSSTTAAKTTTDHSQRRRIEGGHLLPQNALRTSATATKNEVQGSRSHSETTLGSSVRGRLRETIMSDISCVPPAAEQCDLLEMEIKPRGTGPWVATTRGIFPEPLLIPADYGTRHAPRGRRHSTAATMSTTTATMPLSECRMTVSGHLAAPFGTDSMPQPTAATTRSELGSKPVRSPLQPTLRTSPGSGKKTTAEHSQMRRRVEDAHIQAPRRLSTATPTASIKQSPFQLWTPRTSATDTLESTKRTPDSKRKLILKLGPRKSTRKLRSISLRTPWGSSKLLSKTVAGGHSAVSTATTLSSSAEPTFLRSIQPPLASSTSSSASSSSTSSSRGDRRIQSIANTLASASSTSSTTTAPSATTSLRSVSTTTVTRNAAANPLSSTVSRGSRKRNTTQMKEDDICSEDSASKKQN